MSAVVPERMPDGRPDFSDSRTAEKFVGSIKAGYQAYFFDRSPDSCHYHDDDERAAWVHGYNRARAHLLGLPE
jgi:ribosome modulation factor